MSQIAGHVELVMPMNGLTMITLHESQAFMGNGFEQFLQPVSLTLNDVIFPYPGRKSLNIEPHIILEYAVCHIAHAYPVGIALLFYLVYHALDIILGTMDNSSVDVANREYAKDVFTGAVFDLTLYDFHISAIDCFSQPVNGFLHVFGLYHDINCLIPAD